jgi:glutaredoxin 3
MTDIKIYSSRFCGYCTRAKMLLEKKGVEYTEIGVDMDPVKRREMEALAGRTSVPQIFINNEHVGGCDDLYALEHAGQLDERLGLTS